MNEWEKRVEALKQRFTSRITTESTADEINDLNDAAAEVDALNEQYQKSLEENAKLKETIVRMVQTSGNSETPADESGGSKPKTLEEIIAEEQAKQDKEKK